MSNDKRLLRKQNRLIGRAIKAESRLNQKNTPRFWKRVRNWSLIVGAVAGAVLTGGAALPVTVITIATIVSSAAASVAGMASLTKENTKQPKSE